MLNYQMVLPVQGEWGFWESFFVPLLDEETTMQAWDFLSHGPCSSVPRFDLCWQDPSFRRIGRWFQEFFIGPRDSPLGVETARWFRVASPKIRWLDIPFTSSCTPSPLRLRQSFALMDPVMCEDWGLPDDFSRWDGSLVTSQLCLKFSE